MFLCLLVSVRGIRIYLRTGLKGELIGGIGIAILMLGYFGGDIIFVILGFVISNVGWLISFTLEMELRRDIYRKATIYEKVTGDFLKFLNGNESRNALKVTGIISGILCFLSAYEFYNRTKSYDIVPFVNIAILIIAGLSLIVYYLMKKDK